MDKTYTQDKEASGEILRLILQNMGAHPAAFTPPTYAVWYEHLAGINAALSEAMGKLLAEGGQLDTDSARVLFDAYISEGNVAAQAAFRKNMQAVLEKLVKFTESTGNDADRFHAGLQKYGDGLSGGLDASALAQMIGAMQEETQGMRGSVSSLQDNLHDSQGEIVKLQRELQNAKSEALTDPMTKVLNRRGFDAQMKKMLANTELRGKRVSFLMIDIDFFKKVNDTYGHLFGDRVICGLASVLTAQIKGQDSVARLGGEEFAVILPETPIRGAFAVAENIRQRIESSKIRRADTQDFIGGVTVSIGISERAIEADWKVALEEADKALYQSKHNGRNRTTLYQQ